MLVSGIKTNRGGTDLSPVRFQFKKLLNFDLKFNQNAFKTANNMSAKFELYIHRYILFYGFELPSRISKQVSK